MSSKSLTKPIPMIMMTTMFFMGLNAFIPLHFSTITREEAIEISRNTSAVQEFLEDATTYWVNATYLDEEEIMLWKEWRPELFGNFPSDHGVWEIMWTIRLKPSGISQTSLYHYIDEETGEIILELRGVLFV
jgi:hypothetical protein